MDEVLLDGPFLPGCFGVSFDEFAFGEGGSCSGEWQRCGALTAHQRPCADSMSLKAIAIPAALEPGPLVMRWRRCTVAKLDSIGFVALMDPSRGQFHLHNNDPDTDCRRNSSRRRGRWRAIGILWRTRDIRWAPGGLWRLRIDPG